jgi:hypothetical protein
MTYDSFAVTVEAAPRHFVTRIRIVPFLSLPLVASHAARSVMDGHECPVKRRVMDSAPTKFIDYGSIRVIGGCSQIHNLSITDAFVLRQIGE